MTVDPAWRFEMLLARDAVSPSERTSLAEGARRGELVRVTRGVYLPAEYWARLDATEKYLALVRAVAVTIGGDHVFSHASAAALWGLPWIGAWPQEVHAIAPVTDGGRSAAILRRHCVGIPNETATLDGMRVTSLARTAVDLSRSVDLLRAVVMTDAALHREGIGAIERSDLERELEVVPLRHGSARARHVVSFADGRADSPGESVSRVTMARARVPVPVLQQEFPREGGGQWTVDFWWPEQEIIGEFDGRAKYVDPALRGGRTPDDIVYAEKLREDELRGQVRGFARWDWKVAHSPAELARRLRNAGLRW